MPRVILTGSIQQHVVGLGAVDVGGDTAGAPPLRGWVVDERGTLRLHVKLFLHGKAVGLDTVLGQDDELHIVAAISGG